MWQQHNLQEEGTVWSGIDPIAEAKGRRIEIQEFLRPLKISSVSRFMCVGAYTFFPRARRVEGRMGLGEAGYLYLEMIPWKPIRAGGPKVAVPENLKGIEAPVVLVLW